MAFSTKIFDFIITRVEHSPRSVFSKQEIITLLEVAEAAWISISSKELDKENKEATLKSWKEEEDGRVKVDQIKR